tara:strand:- start:9946 stop:10851 length:906 start_codon:yes stop_codon:yes gene_type:complete
MDTIDGMRTFVAVAKQKSFTSGAKLIGISTKLASKYIGQLEERLDAQLFHRTTRSVTLTETGQAYFLKCVPVLEQFAELEDVVQQGQSELAGVIRITAPTGFGSTKLVEALAPFQKMHPKVSIDMRLSDHIVSIVDEGIDLAIRFGKLEDSTMIARKLMDMRIVVFASPDYLAEFGRPKHPSALSTHNCLLQQFSIEPHHWQFKISGEMKSYPVMGSYSANSPRAVAHMAAAGLGIGAAPAYVVESYIKEGSLKLLFEDNEARIIPLHAVYPSGRHLPKRIRVLIEHLAMVFKASSLGPRN